MAAEADRFVQKIKLPSGRTAVVADGDYEPRSIGSYSVRIYSGQNPDFPFEDYVVGVIRARPEGYIEKIMLADIDGDGHDEIVVIFRCVGTGQFLSAEAFAFDKERLFLRASVEGLERNANPVTALKKVKK